MRQELTENDILVVDSGRFGLPLEEPLGVYGSDLDLVAADSHLDISIATEIVDCRHVIRAIERCLHREHVQLELSGRSVVSGVHYKDIYWLNQDK